MSNYNPPRQVTPSSPDFAVDISPTQNVAETQTFEEDIKKEKTTKEVLHGSWIAQKSGILERSNRKEFKIRGFRIRISLTTSFLLVVMEPESDSC